MPVVPASLLCHRGHGPQHVDLILGTGARCLTVHLGSAGGRWKATIGQPHRRRYLTYRGPVRDRGVVSRLWSGSAWWSRSAQAVHCRLLPNHLILMKMSRIFHGSRPLAGRSFRGRSEVVVPLPPAATLSRS